MTLESRSRSSSLAWRRGRVDTDISDTSVVSLAGAALLAVGLSEDLRLLSTPCVVVRAPDLVR